jgi:hypothetical protein
MKTRFNKARNSCAAMAVRAKAAADTAVANATAAARRSRMALAGNKAEGFVDTAVKVLMAVVIGALVLAGLYLLFSGTILPTLTQRIQDKFNYKG